MKLLVLAGGFGTRLQSAVPGVPKALAPVGGVPFLHLQIQNWIGQGVKSFVFLLHHQAALGIDFLRKEQLGLLRDCEVTWVVEPYPMGTGGALAHAVSELGITGSFLVTNADTWLGSGMQDVFCQEAPSMAVVQVEDAGRYGRVQCDAGGRISAFREKQVGSGPGLINAGLSHLHAGLFANWDREPFSLEAVNFPVWADEGCLKAVPLHSSFIDIGIPDDYFRFCRWVESGKVGAP
ncbi:MAG: sugar phosphate nucleotidyltransferase [Pseudomonadota bacterium]